jgi:hypothetical protein
MSARVSRPRNDALIYVAYSGILSVFDRTVRAGTASVATLYWKGAVTCNRRRPSRLGFPCGLGPLEAH